MKNIVRGQTDNTPPEVLAALKNEYKAQHKRSNVRTAQQCKNKKAAPVKPEKLTRERHHKKGVNIITYARKIEKGYFKMTLYEQIKNALKNMDINDLVNIHNEYCDAANYPDNRIYSMEEFDELMSGSTPWEIARSAFYGDFRPCDDYFYFNGYGNLASFDYIGEDNTPIYIDDIAEYIEREGDDLWNDEIKDILAENAELTIAF